MSTKEKVLASLKEAATVVSGEALAQQLSLSRTSIWKAVKELEKMGYPIKRSGNGYRLLPADILDPAEITRLLQGTAQQLALTLLAESESTMKDARLANANGASSPRLLFADMQGAPHGRFRRPFFAREHEGIYMSLLLNPEKPFSELPQYTVLMAVAVTDAILELTGIETDIKWVNDIYLKGKKICGILSEAVSDVDTGMIQAVIIGIGCNFSIPQTAFPAELQAKASSLFSEGTPTINRNQLIAAIWNRFFALLEQLPNQDYLQTYKKRSFVLGKQVSFTQQNTLYRGIATDITAKGELVVNCEDGQRILSSGEISLQAIDEITGK